MKGLVRLLVAGAFCVVAAVGAIVWITGGMDWSRLVRPSVPPAPPGTSSETEDPNVTWYPDPNAPGTDARVCVDRRLAGCCYGRQRIRVQGNDPGPQLAG